MDLIIFFLRYFLKGLKIILRWMSNSAMLLSITANSQSSSALKDDHITVSLYLMLYMHSKMGGRTNYSW